MLALINGLLLSAVLFISLLVSISTLGQARFAQITRPPTQGYIAEVMKLKSQAAKSITKPKIVIVSGSGGFFSISCETITQTIKAPCVNAALPIEVGLPGILRFAETIAQPGDVLLMPMEYAMYYVSQFSGVAEKPEKPSSLIERMMNSDFHRLFRVDLAYVFFSLAENALAAADYRPYSIDALFTPIGDRKGHTKADGQRFAEKVAKEPIYEMKYQNGGVMTEGFVYHMGQFLDWARANNVKAIATLQPAFDDWEIPEAWIKNIASFYEKNGAVFVRPENLYHFPRSDFYDGSPHLNEETQKRHSVQVAKDIAPFLPPSLRESKSK